MIQKEEKNSARIIYALASLTMGLRICLDSKQNKILIIISLILFTLLAVIYIDRSNYFPFKFIKKDYQLSVKNGDNIGQFMVIYLFYLALVK